MNEGEIYEMAVKKLLAGRFTNKMAEHKVYIEQLTLSGKSQKRLLEEYFQPKKMQARFSIPL